MAPKGQDQAVDDGAEIGDARDLGPPLLQLMIEKSHVEGGVMNDELGAPDESEKLLGDVAEPWLVAQEVVGDAMNIEGALFHVTIGPQVAMKIVAGGPPLHQFDAADLDDAMALAGLQASGFSIEDDLTHGRLPGNDARRVVVGCGLWAVGCGRCGR